jgi:hypothetical protein
LRQAAGKMRVPGRCKKSGPAASIAVRHPVKTTVEKRA